MGKKGLWRAFCDCQNRPDGIGENPLRNDQRRAESFVWLVRSASRTTARYAIKRMPVLKPR